MIQRIRHQCLSRIKNVGSNPIPSTFLTSTVSFEKYLREEKRLAPTTIKSKIKLIKRLNKRVNLWAYEEVERYVINAEMTIR